MFYNIYAVEFVIVIALSVILFKQNKIQSLILSNLFTLISSLFFYWFAKLNIFTTYTCDESTGCMNETAIILIFAMFFMFFADVVLAISVVSKKFDPNV